MARDHLSIPAFLDAKNHGKKIRPKMPKGWKPPPPIVKIDEAGEVLESMPEAQRAWFESQIASGAIRRHWIVDPGVVALAWHQKANREEARRQRIAALKLLPKPERPPPLPAFGLSTTFVVVKPNPRKAGTGAAIRYAEMIAWKKKNPEGTVAALIAATSYTEIDYRWDEERGHIKSGVGKVSLDNKKEKK